MYIYLDNQSSAISSIPVVGKKGFKFSIMFSTIRFHIILAIIFCLCLCMVSSNSIQHQLTYNFSPGLGYYTTRHDKKYSLASSSFREDGYNNHSPFLIVNEWKYLDFEYPTFTLRQQAIASKSFIPENNLPLGIDVHKDRLFITTPRWKDGVPASIGYLPYPPIETSPAIRPYPDWEAHGDPSRPDCRKLISVYRTSIDHCGRLWLIDSGIVNATINLNQICQPKIVAFDLATNKPIVRYEIPPDQTKQDSLFSNVLADVRHGQCHDAHVYVTDVWRYGLVVYSLAKNRSWRVTNYLFSPNPLAADFNVYGLNFQWMDGVFGMSLSVERNPQQERVLYFHPMASYKEFVVSTDLLRDESKWPGSAQDVAKYFLEVGDRGALGQSSTSGIARNGVMFYTQVHRDDIGCWDTAKAYTRANLVSLVGNRTKQIRFPNDLTVDSEEEQGIWVMSNRLPVYLYSQLDYSEINFRILRASVWDAIVGTNCDPISAGNTKGPEMNQQNTSSNKQLYHFQGILKETSENVKIFLGNETDIRYP